MNKVINKDIFKAAIVIGLQKGYSKQLISETEIIKYLQDVQEDLITTKNIFLSANCFSSTVVLSGQAEPHLNLHFFNYPRFPLTEDSFKEAIGFIAEKLMDAFDQNRLVIQFHDSNVMLEKTNDVDPDITKTKNE